MRAGASRPYCDLVHLLDYAVLTSVLPQFFPYTWILLTDTMRATRDTIANKRESFKDRQVQQILFFPWEAVESFEITETNGLPEVVPEVTSTGRLGASHQLSLVST